MCLSVLICEVGTVLRDCCEYWMSKQGPRDLSWILRFLLLPPEQPRGLKKTPLRPLPREGKSYLEDTQQKFLDTEPIHCALCNPGCLILCPGGGSASFIPS